MEYAALASFGLLVVSWMALPASNGRVFEEQPVPIRAEVVGAEA
jgi:hypothetical protein